MVKVFNHIYWQLLEQPEFDGVQADAYYYSNDDQAKAVAAQLSAQSGFNPVDCGPIKHARYLEPLAVLWMQLAFTMHNGPEIAFKLLQQMTFRMWDFGFRTDISDPKSQIKNPQSS